MHRGREAWRGEACDQGCRAAGENPSPADLMPPVVRFLNQEAAVFAELVTK
ncbi:MAG: hypothetical protein AABM42_09120 [Actinomycetota bacterium]